jgi:hypothetical protein
VPGNISTVVSGKVDLVVSDAAVTAVVPVDVVSADVVPAAVVSGDVVSGDVVSAVVVSVVVVSVAVVSAAVVAAAVVSGDVVSAAVVSVAVVSVAVVSAAVVAAADVVSDDVVSGAVVSAAVVAAADVVSDDVVSGAVVSDAVVAAADVVSGDVVSVVSDAVVSLEVSEDVVPAVVFAVVSAVVVAVVVAVVSAAVVSVVTVPPLPPEHVVSTLNAVCKLQFIPEYFSPFETMATQLSAEAEPVIKVQLISSPFFFPTIPLIVAVAFVPTGFNTRFHKYWPLFNFTFSQSPLSKSLVFFPTSDDLNETFPLAGRPLQPVESAKTECIGIKNKNNPKTSKLIPIIENFSIFLILTI